MRVHNFNTLQQFLREKNVFADFGIERVGVFGSFARGEKFNDIDILLEQKVDFEKREALKQFLEKELSIPVDIVVKDYAEPIILHRALKEIKYATAA
jgi:predicted nucleotidyltransferase